MILSGYPKRNEYADITLNVYIYLSIYVCVTVLEFCVIFRDFCFILNNLDEDYIICRKMKDLHSHIYLSIYLSIYPDLFCISKYNFNFYMTQYIITNEYNKYTNKKCQM